LVLALGAVVPACSSETVPPPPPPPISWTPAAHVNADAGPVLATDKERAAAGAYAKALSSPDLAGALTRVLDDDAHFSFVGMKDAHGRDKVIAAHQFLFGAFDQRSFVAGRVWLTDSAQAIEWTLSGVQARDWMNVSATKKPVVIKGVTLLSTNDDGSITDVRVNFDEALVKAQLGGGPKELASVPVPQPAAAMTEIEQAKTDAEVANVATVRASIAALARGDEAGYLGTMTDDFELSTEENAHVARGKEEARAYLKALHKEVTDVDASIDTIFGAKDFVVVEYFLFGTQQAPIGWVPLQRDRLLKMAIVDVVQMQGGKIAHVWHYDDPGQVLSAP
jgi:ketosteroid isomerase-like protein